MDTQLVDNKVVITNEQDAKKYINSKLQMIEFHLKQVENIQNELLSLTQSNGQ